MLYFPAWCAGFLASGGRGCTLIRVYSPERLKRHLNGLKRAPVFGWVFSGVAAWPGVVPGCSITGFKLFSRCRCISGYTGQLQPFKMGLVCLIRSGRVKNSGVRSQHKKKYPAAAAARQKEKHRNSGAYFM
jgi:hypothetical protein